MNHSRRTRGPRVACFSFLALLLAGLALAGCGKNEPRADITIINGAEPESLDPAIITGQPDGRVAGALFEGLTRLNAKTATPEPALAQRWEISPDGKVFTFHLRTNAVWSTGGPITAEDVVYSWRRVVDPLTASDYAGQLFLVKNAEEINTGKIKDLAALGAHVIDSHTLRVELIAPATFFLDLCAFRTLAVVPRAAIEKHGDQWIMMRPLPTSGPYTLDAWRIRDKIRVRKNPLHWDAANVLNEVVDFLPVESPNTALNLYESGSADIIWDKGLVPTELLDVLRRRPDCHNFDYLGTYFYRYNVTHKPFDDPRVRKALALAVDKRRLVERITRAGEKTASHLTPPGTANYTAPEGLGHDVALAKKLLAEAGFPDGKGFPPFQYLYNSSKLHEQIAVELQQMWKETLGLKMELRQTEWKVYLAEQSNKNYHLCRSSWIGDYNDPNTFLDMFMSNNGNNRTGWANPRYDQLIRDANQETDVKRRAALLGEAEALLIRDGLPIVPLYFYVGVTFYDPKKIEGIYSNVLDEHPIYTIRKRR
ncbi:MAG: peptide ABC transporter substrate-binding protein [Pedosphaera sp.]|nr:peptide ABC transporter substrate-binding protein [Pedosphaera sp.]